jgi:hypothetical protein
MTETPNREFPVRPSIEQLRKQARELLRAMHRGEPAALAELRAFSPRPVKPTEVKLSHAQNVLARSCGLTSWHRLAIACRITNAIWDDDLATVLKLVRQNPRLLDEGARGIVDNWGPPMSYAANIGRDTIIEALHGLGATDVQHAFVRACLQGKLETAQRLLAKGGQIPRGIVMGPCETLNGNGLAFQLELGAELMDDHGDSLAPVAMILETYSRNPEGKHRCLELVAERMDLPDTPPMAVHRGRIDLLEAHLRRDPKLLSRTFSHQEIYPLSLGCHEDKSLALHGTPLAGSTLLHLAVDDEIDIVRWLLQNGMDVNAPAEIDAEGFGGHTALFGCVVSQSYLCGRQRDGELTRLLLDHGADPNARANLRKTLRFVDDETEHQYRDVTPLSWGHQFHDRRWVNRNAMRLIEERGGQK